MKTIDGVRRIKQVGDHGPEKLKPVHKCSVSKATDLLSSRKPCKDGLGNKGKSHSDNLSGLERSITVGKNITYGNECYTDRDIRVEAMS